MSEWSGRVVITYSVVFLQGFHSANKGSIPLLNLLQIWSLLILILIFFGFCLF